MAASEKSENCPLQFWFLESCLLLKTNIISRVELEKIDLQWDKSLEVTEATFHDYLKKSSLDYNLQGPLLVLEKVGPIL